MRPLRARGLDLEVAQVSPEYDLAARTGHDRAAQDVDLSRSGMASMPGQGAPQVVQPMAAPASPEPTLESEPDSGRGSGGDAGRSRDEEEK